MSCLISTGIKLFIKKFSDVLIRVKLILSHGMFFRVR